MERERHSSVMILIRSGNGNPGRVRGMMGVRKPPGSRGKKVRGEINAMRSLYGFYSPLMCCTCTVKRVHVVLVQAEEYRW